MDVNREQLHDQDLDRWLDAALRARVDVEPRIGLEKRVLAQLAMEPQSRTLMPWPVFAAVTVGLLVAAALTITRLMTDKPAITKAPAPIATPSKLEPPAIQAGHLQQKQVDVARRHGAPALLVRPAVNREEAFPKLATFPSTRPETAQERLLARLAARRDSYDVARNSAEEMVALKDLSVPELNIKPLEGTPPDNPPQH